MANALIVRKIQLPKFQRTVRAAQYIRVSTDHQRYSIQNQAAAIAAYAASHNLTIVDTYSDEGESGLRIKNRNGLIELIDDVRLWSGRCRLADGIPGAGLAGWLMGYLVQALPVG